MGIAEQRQRTHDKKFEARLQQIEKAVALRNKGFASSAIAEKLGLPESTVRSLLKTSL